MKKKRLKKAALFIAAAALLTACGSSKTSDGSVAYEAAYDTAPGYGYITSVNNATAVQTSDYSNGVAADTTAEEYAVEGEGGDVGKMPEENVDASGRKLIKTVNIDAETEHYDTLIANLAAQISELGGYIEYQNEYNGSRFYEEIDPAATGGGSRNRSADWNIRIPEQRLDEFVVFVDGESNIISKTEQVEDVTLQYVDLESHKNALVTEQKRLLELLEKAETVEDIISIEQRLSEVRYELENMESQLRVMDNKIDYSTVRLSIQEVKREVRVSENSVFDRIRNGFIGNMDNLKNCIVNIFVWFVVNIVNIIICAAVIIVVVMLIKKFIRKKKNKSKNKGKHKDRLNETLKEAESEKTAEEKNMEDKTAAEKTAEDKTADVRSENDENKTGKEE